MKRLVLSAALCPLLLLLDGCFAYIPTGTEKNEAVVATRLAGDGTHLEEIVEAKVTGKRFYPATAEGMAINTYGEPAYRYRLRRPDGHEQQLPFLNKQEMYEQILAFTPLTGGRWIAVNMVADVANYEKGADTLEVTVFASARLLFRKQVPACLRYSGPEYARVSQWNPLRPDLKPGELNYVIDAATGLATFRTDQGDYVFDTADGSLRQTKAASKVP